MASVAGAGAAGEWMAEDTALQLASLQAAVAAGTPAAAAEEGGGGVETTTEELRIAVYRVLDSCTIPLEPLRIAWAIRRSDRRMTIKELADAVRALRCREQKRGAHSSPFREWLGHMFLARREFDMKRSCLVTREYRDLGMTLLTGIETAVKYIPPDVEHRFLEIRPSAILGAGAGLFLRRNRRIRRGTIVCEYVGKLVKKVSKIAGCLPYAVTTHGGDCINGIDDDGNLLSLAAMINDNGPALANVQLQSFESLPRRAFVAALRDIEPGEELYVLYGASYWGIGSYSEVRDSPQKPKRGGRGRQQSLLEQIDMYATKCRDCGASVAQRAKLLHMAACKDPLTNMRVADIECLPMNDFTAFDFCNFTSFENTRRVAFFVDGSDANTLSHTYEFTVDDDDELGAKTAERTHDAS